ncbi:MAG: hypothetical protein ABI402_00205 [Ferruginibacter sp.]
MKKFKLALLSLIILVGTSYGQGSSKGWAEQKAFHSYMAATFHPAEDGDFKPLKEKADSLYISAKAWFDAPIPADYKPEETKAALKQLVMQCGSILKLVKTGVAKDEELKKMISEAHDTFHKIAGECKKPAAEEAAH